MSQTYSGNETKLTAFCAGGWLTSKQNLPPEKYSVLHLHLEPEKY